MKPARRGAGTDTAGRASLQAMLAGKADGGAMAPVQQAAHALHEDCPCPATVSPASPCWPWWLVLASWASWASWTEGCAGAAESAAACGAPVPQDACSAAENPCRGSAAIRSQNRKVWKARCIRGSIAVRSRWPLRGCPAVNTFLQWEGQAVSSGHIWAVAGGAPCTRDAAASRVRPWTVFSRNAPWKSLDQLASSVRISDKRTFG